MPIGDGLGLPDQLVKSLFDKGATALLVNVNSVSNTRRLSIEEYPNPH